MINSMSVNFLKVQLDANMMQRDASMMHCDANER